MKGKKKIWTDLILVNFTQWDTMRITACELHTIEWKTAFHNWTLSKYEKYRFYLAKKVSWKCSYCLELLGKEEFQEVVWNDGDLKWSIVAFPHTAALRCVEIEGRACVKIYIPSRFQVFFRFPSSLFISVCTSLSDKLKVSQSLWRFISLRLWSRHWVLRGIPSHCAAESLWCVIREENC